MHIKQERRCVACRQNKQQNEMLRIARIDNKYLIDIQHHHGGRGAYVCRDPKCIELTIKKRLLNRSFKTNVDEQIYKLLGVYEQDN